MEKLENADRKISDMSSVLSLVSQIECPCSVEANGRTYNIRDFYLKEAERLMPSLISSNARDLLHFYLNKYNR